MKIDKKMYFLCLDQFFDIITRLKFKLIFLVNYKVMALSFETRYISFY